MKHETFIKKFKDQTGLGISEFKIEFGSLIIIPKLQLLDVEHLDNITKFIRTNFMVVGIFRHKLPKFQPVYNKFGGIELGLRIPESAIK
jgi:hypothetical protein